MKNSFFNRETLLCYEVQELSYDFSSHKWFAFFSQQESKKTSSSQYRRTAIGPFSKGILL
jgi:hypothetical protein